MNDDTIRQEGQPIQNESGSVYANNVRFESTAWDLRIYFGQLVPGGKLEVKPHTDVTLSWTQAKLMSFYLQVNIELYEAENGRIRIPQYVLPQPVLGADGEQDTTQSSALSILRTLVEQFRSENSSKDT